MGKKTGPRSVQRRVKAAAKASKPSGLFVLSHGPAATASVAPSVASLALIHKSNPNPKVASLFRAGASILLVGEGDFTFARALYMVLGAGGVVATSFDSRSEVGDKYPDAGSVIDTLTSAGVPVRHGVDGTQLHEGTVAAWLASVAPEGFDAVVFNFPHVGGATSADVALNQAVIRAFLSSATRVLKARGGKVIVSLRVTPFYDSWDVAGMASGCGAASHYTLPFDVSAFPGYRPVRTHPAMREAPELDSALMHVFVHGPGERALVPPPPPVAPVAPVASGKKVSAAVALQGAKGEKGKGEKEKEKGKGEKAKVKGEKEKGKAVAPLFQGTLCTLCKEDVGTPARIPIHILTPWHMRKANKAGVAPDAGLTLPSPPPPPSAAATVPSPAPAPTPRIAVPAPAVAPAPAAPRPAKKHKKRGNTMTAQSADALADLDSVRSGKKTKM